MTILQRYLLKQNLYYLLLIFGLGMGIYLLVDVFDRLEKFLNQGVPLKTTAWYFVLKLPLIVTELLPIVFLLAMLIQLGLMARSREIVALEASAVSMLSLIRFFLVWALAWTAVHFLFSQHLGYASDRVSSQIWDVHVRNKEIANRTLYNVWFKHDQAVVHLQEVIPSSRSGRGLTVYQTAEDSASLTKILAAQTFTASKDGQWTLHQAVHLDPFSFEHTGNQTMVVNLGTDPGTFAAVDPKTDPEGLSLWQLGRVINDLKTSGSGVARLRTAWHMKLAYTFSTVCLALVGSALVLSLRNVYLLVFLGLISVFVYYVVFLTGVAAGENSTLNPIVAAWMANMILGVAALGRIAWIFRPVRPSGRQETSV